MTCLSQGLLYGRVSHLRGRARRLLAAQGAQLCLIVVDYLQLWAKTSRELRDLSDVRAKVKVDTLGGELIALEAAGCADPRSLLAEPRRRRWPWT